MRSRAVRQAVVAAGMLGAVAGFYLPWVRLDVRESAALQRLQAAAAGRGRVAVTIRRGAQTVAGELPTLADLPQRISGADIPRLVRQPNARAAIALMETVTQEHQHLELKSLLVYLLPGVALLCGGLLLACDGRRLAAAGAGLGCAAVAAAGGWALLRAVHASPLLTVTIEPGARLSLGSCAALAAAAAWAAADGRTRLH